MLAGGVTSVAAALASTSGLAAQLGFLLLDQRWLRWAAAIAMCWFWAVLTLAVWAWRDSRSLKNTSTLT